MAPSLLRGATSGAGVREGKVASAKGHARKQLPEMLDDLAAEYGVDFDNPR